MKYNLSKLKWQIPFDVPSMNTYWPSSSAARGAIANEADEEKFASGLLGKHFYH